MAPPCGTLTEPASMLLSLYMERAQEFEVFICCHCHRITCCSAYVLWTFAGKVGCKSDEVPDIEGSIMALEVRPETDEHYVVRGSMVLSRALRIDSHVSTKQHSQMLDCGCCPHIHARTHNSLYCLLNYIYSLKGSREKYLIL